MNLYQLSQEFLDAMDFLSNPDNQIDNQTIADTMEGISLDFQAKALSTAKYICSRELFAEQMRIAAKSRLERANQIDAQAGNLRQYLLQCLEATGNKKLEDAEIQISTRKVPDSVMIEDEAKIPDQFVVCTEVKRPDKAAIKAAGGCPGASIKGGGSILVIKG